METIGIFVMIPIGLLLFVFLTFSLSIVSILGLLIVFSLLWLNFVFIT